jgi:hypothetical protein
MEKKDIRARDWITQDDPVYFSKDLRYTLTPEVESLFRKVSGNTPIRRELNRLAEAFSCLLANLFHAYVLDAPLIYSRSANAYVIERKRYGYEFYTYKMMVRLVDALYQMGLINGVKGRKTPTGQCLTSKIWATEELEGLFQTMGGCVFTKHNNEVLYLKGENKLLLNYRESKLTRGMRRQIRDLNEMLGSLDMEFRFTPAELADNAEGRYRKFKRLIGMSDSNAIEIVEYNSTTVSGSGNTDTTANHITKYYIDRSKKGNISYNINNIEFMGSVNREANNMRRVFNLDWHHGGRFYKAPHITMPSACRKTMRINGEPTVEPDYSGQHIRMLYNLIGNVGGKGYTMRKVVWGNTAPW